MNEQPAADPSAMAPDLPTARRVLVAGIGNVLRGDDGFGPAVITALTQSGRLSRGVKAIEVGIGGISLVHELMDGYDALILVDAVERGGEPGRLYVLEPQVPAIMAMPSQARRELSADMHQAVPASALVLAQAVGALPPVIRMIGCQPAEIEEFCVELSQPVQAAVGAATEIVLSLLSGISGNQGTLASQHRRCQHDG